MPRKRTTCHWCSAPAGPRTNAFCDYHAGYHAGRQSIGMPAKRAADPGYRELEREAVRKRMRRLRADPNYVRPDRPTASAP
jgi:hypothetical protein